MTNQKQSASDNAVAVQAGGNVTISQGMSPADVSEMLGAIARLTAASFPGIQEQINARFLVLEQKLEAKFQDAKQASTKAFNDPDFHAALRLGFTGHARNPEVAVTDTLVELIARRCSKRSVRVFLCLSMTQSSARRA